MRLPVATRRWLLAGSFLLGAATHAQAQLAPAAAAPHGYDFLTVTVVESPYKKEPRIFLVPTFAGKAEVPLEPTDYYAISPDNRAKLVQNTQLVNTQLSDLTSAGWELTSTSVVPVSGSTYRQAITRYLFRKPRP